MDTVHKIVARRFEFSRNATAIAASMLLLQSVNAAQDERVMSMDPERELTVRELQLNRDVQGLQTLRSALQRTTDRPIRVLAQLSEATVVEGGSRTRVAAMTGISAARLQTAKINASRILSEQNIQEVRPVEGLPLVTFALRQSQLDAMAESGQFASVVEDRLSQAYLVSSGNLMDVPELHALGARGAGSTVAVLDTGVDVDHPFLNGRVVEGACFSSNFAPHGATSVCPGGADSGVTLASGGECGVDGCDHGTHVAGIAAGRSTPAIALSGVAPDADIMAVQVFSRFDDAPGGPNTCASVGARSPCILSYTSDQIRALQRVLARANTRNIVAVNMSLGGGQVNGTCDAAEAAIKSIMDQLRAQGIATVVASGNDGFKNSIGAPACVSTAVAVGSTTDGDQVSSFSNMSNTVDLLAVGSSIDSSVPGGGFDNFQGTSMATPQVAGAVAALASCPSDPTVAAILTALESTGVAVTDARSGGSVTKNRIDLDAAAAALPCADRPDPDRDCIGHDPDNLELSSRGWWFWRTWTIVDNSHSVFYFGSNRSEAEEALGIIKRFGFTNTCYIRRPNASMQYLRTGQAVPGGSSGGLDCIDFNRATVGIQQQSNGRWLLADGASSMLDFPSEDEAQQAVDAINKHSLNRQCFVGRPDPSFTFWLAE